MTGPPESGPADLSPVSRTRVVRVSGTGVGGVELLMGDGGQHHEVPPQRSKPPVSQTGSRIRRTDQLDRKTGRRHGTPVKSSHPLTERRRESHIQAQPLGGRQGQTRSFSRRSMLMA